MSGNRASAGSGIKTTGVDVARRAHTSQAYNVNNLNGVYIAEVINDSDALHNGRVTVRIPELGTTAERIILLTTPFGGNTEIKKDVDDVTSYDEAPKTYGMWPQPPAPGSNILVAFVGSIEQGFMLGYVPPSDRNATMGGNASSISYEGDTKILSATGEKIINDTDPDTRPANPEAVAHLMESGLAGDFVRGHSQSSARRESPSNVFGLTSKAGHTISMDDGAEDGSSNNIRIKTRGGQTILLDDSNGFIFITNKGGSSWIEMDAEGQIDIYSQGGVSVGTDGDYNVHAKGSINFESEQGINFRSTGSNGIKVQSTVGSIDVHSGIDFNTTALKQTNLTSGTNIYAKAPRIDLNGPEPTPATECTPQGHVMNTGVVESVNSRVPEHHPWKGASTIEESLNFPKGNKS